MGWRRVLRRALAWSVGPPLVVLAAGLGTVLVLLYTPSGRTLTARALTDWISARVAGRVTIGNLRGSILRHVVLEDVSVHDSTGALVIAVPRLEARYVLPELLTGRIIVRELDAQRPVINLQRLRRGRWNYQEVFRSGGGDGGGAPPRVELRDVAIHGGTLRVEVPTDPGPPRQPISRRGAAPAQPEVTEGSDGPVRVYRASDLTARLPLIRVSTPRNDPILVEVASLAAVLSDPALRIVDVEGEVLTKGDSLRFRFDRAELPGTRLSGSGAVRWPEDTIRYDFTLDADTVSLADLRWIQPDFPDWRGRGRVVALSTTNRHSEFVLEELALGAGRASAAGRLVAIVDEDRGFGVRDLDLALREVSLEVMRPYLDTLPFRGTVTGALRADGYRTLLDLAGELAFVDELPPGAPTSQFDFAGAVAFGGAEGAVFRGFTLREALIEMGTVRAQVPAVALPGRLRLVGRLDGPWQNATFVGTAEHLAPNDALSRLTGTVRLDTRGELLAIGMDAIFDRLSFDGMRTGYPALTPQGGMSGRVVATGPLDALVIDADVTGDFGDVVARGTVGATAPRYTFTELVLDVRRLNLEAVTGRGENTALNGRLVATGVLDSGAAPVGTLALDLGQSRIGGVTLSGVRGTARSDGRLLEFDTLTADWAGGALVATGSLGWTAADSGAARLSARGFSLAPFDSLARATLRLRPDSILHHPLEGTGRAEFAVAGSIEAPRIDGEVEAEQVRIDDWRLGRLAATVAADSLSRQGLRIHARADTVSKGRHVAEDIDVAIGGRADSVAFAASGRLTDSRLALGGWRKAGESVDRIGLDSLILSLPRQQWQLVEPTSATVTDQLITLADTVVIRTADGSGLVTLAGNVPGAGSGELEASVVGLDLADIYSLLGRDTSAVGGLAQVDLRLGGTRDAPTLRGNAMITGARFRDANPPLLRASYDYRDRLLRSNITFWRLGEPVLEVDGSVPFDLALAARERRRLHGPIAIHAIADSADLSILEAFTTSVRSTTGAMSLDLEVSGTWDDPELAGTAAVHQGRTTIPNLGVRYGPIEGRATFAGDSMLVERLTLASGEGELAIDGSVRFEDLDRTMLNLELTSRRFLAINVPGFLVARPTGTVTLTGPLTRPVMRGTSVAITESDVYFADMINKNVINLEDPRYRDLVDLEALRRQRLGTAFQNRFLDSLRIENLRVQVGTDVWLRSTEAEIQLEGAVQVSKTGRNYVVAGELDTPRGEYTLNIRGIFNRKFVIERGTVTYLGTADLNAELDIQARYLVRADDGDEIPIVARITGTILAPVVELSSPGRNLPQRDILAYLMVGRPEFELAGAGARNALALQTVITAFSGELERQVVQESGLGIDLFEIRPGVGSGFGGGSAELQSLTAGLGVQLGSRWFVTLNAGLCFDDQQAAAFSARNLGASIEYRFARDWKVQASAEPGSCLSSRLSDAFSNITRRYQLGADLLWEREY